jgi:hypothetical protein
MVKYLLKCTRASVPLERERRRKERRKEGWISKWTTQDT